MRKIALACVSGMSTSMLEMRMQEAAEAAGDACAIRAYPLSDIKKIPKDVDVLLLGPQVRFQLEKLEGEFSCPVLAITMAEYGAMDGAGVLARVREVLGDGNR